MLSGQSGGEAQPINQKAEQGSHIQTCLFEGHRTLNESGCRKRQTAERLCQFYKDSCQVSAFSVYSYKTKVTKCPHWQQVCVSGQVK